MITANVPTSDKLIRATLKKKLELSYRGDSDTKIIEELGVAHGAARVDVAVVNGAIHGYELKSDLDTLYRLPEQMRLYNLVLDQVTLIVGKNHLHEAFKIVPDWWGITIAKTRKSNKKIVFCNIREAEQNPNQDGLAIARLLWRQEALDILEDINQVRGVRSKPRETIYKRLTESLDNETLKARVREHLRTRVNWRVD